MLGTAHLGGETTELKFNVRQSFNFVLVSRKFIDVV